MADALQAMLNQILAAVPEGVSPYDGLRGYFLGQVYHQTDAFDRGCYAIMGLSSAVIALMLLALIFRWRSGSLTWVIRDGAMSRPDFRTFCPIFYIAFAASEIAQSAVIVKAYRDQHWTAFGGAFQYMSLAFIVFCGYILVFNVLASNPTVRRALMSVGSLNRSRGPMGVLILNSLLLFCMLASVGSLVPSAVILAREMPGQNDDVAAIFAVIAQAEAANDLTLLAGLAGPVTTLLGRGDEVKHAIKLAGYTTCAWLVGIWTLGGTIAYVSLVKAVKARIAKLERFVMEEETRQAETNALYSTLVELPRGAKTKVQPKLSADKPFANLVPTTDMPAKFSDIIGSQISETSTKIRQLKAVLRRDQITHFLYLIMILIFSTESVMHACGGVDKVATTKLLPMVHSYLAAAFLSTALPLGFTFLYDSFRLWQHQHAGSQYAGSNSSFSPQGLTYDIPLHVSARGPTSEKRNAHHHQSATSLPMHGHSLSAASPLGGAIMVSQSHTVVVESGFGKDEKDDADKYSI